TNSLRHTPVGGSVTIRGQVEDQAVCVSVEDTGEGLDAQHLPLVFDRFYRGDISRSRDTGGTGLGLAIVKAILEEHRGRVLVDSKGKGHGSTFTVYLPARTPQLSP
ncbi:MAG: two-component sensor histidine kinase, partial [Anaerolineaceae bacterium]|nr:two-component sensor histidine kinase [Anaerolineaceae bacterium]